ncbi:MAG: hypothetical protein K5765_03680 [Clostridia bacterium]|nr:hypothetical protein [Clostridia bacterium]
MNKLIKKRKTHIHPSFWELFLSFPKSIIFNLKVLPFKQAIRVPIFVSYRTKLIGVNKKSFVVNFCDKPKFGSCRLGISGSESGHLIPKKSLVLIRNGGKITINGVFGFSRGVYLHCDEGTMTFGNNFKANYNAHISCEHSSIIIGDGCSLGWDCTIKTCDGHHILVNGEETVNYGPIEIGNHCWVCSKASILKNGFLGSDCVLAYNSILGKKVSDKDHLLYAGQPARIVKENIDWKV